MKTLKLFGLMLFASVIAQAQGVKFSNEKPVAGEKVTFTYDQKGTNLENLTDVKCSVFTFFSGSSPRATRITLNKEGDLYKGEITAPDSVTLVGLSFNVGDQKDEAPEGYILKYSKAGKIPAEAYLNEAFLYGLAGNYYLGLTLDPERAATLYKQAFAAKPALKIKNLNSYLSVELKANKEAGTQLINNQIKSTSKLKDPKEEDFSGLIGLYTLLKQKTQADSVKAILLKKYPAGNYAWNQDLNAFYATKDFNVQEQKANEIITKFKLDPQNKTDKSKLATLNSILSSAAIKAKNVEKFELYSGKIENKVTRASLYNSFAWPLAEKNENVEVASKFSKKSLDLLEEAKNDEKPANYATKEDYVKSLNQSYGMFADTYALLQYHQGNLKDALEFQEKAMSLSASASPDMVSRYVTYLAKSGKDETAYTLAEKQIRDGKADDALKAEFKLLYTKLKKEGSYETFIANLEKAAIEKERAEWTKKMINLPAPGFSLKNLKGETVSLTGLKGKIVVLDYWATWCGPCVASFPGMQKAMAKYSGNPNVVFLFVNTWQTEDNREKVVTDFVAEKKLNFNILYDTKNAKDPSKFDVVSAYKVDGIPTKFIIDGEGNIRFKAVGFSGSDDGVVKEIDAMIGLLSPKENSK